LAVAKFGSQGQQKTYVIALRLAQAAVIEQLTGQKPLLLLDDIFDKLDESRIRKLLNKIDDGEFGRVFITDARPERTQSLLQQLQREVKMISL
jgi:DNA replication and repair protein RecF